MGAEGWGWGWGVPTGQDMEGQGAGPMGAAGRRHGRAVGLTVGEERLGQLSEEGFQQAADDVQVLPPLRGQKGLLSGTAPGQTQAPAGSSRQPRATSTKRDPSQGHHGHGDGRRAVPTPHPAGKAQHHHCAVRCKDTNVAPSCGQHPLGGPATTGMVTARRRGRDGDRDQNGPRSTPRARRRGHAALTSSCRLISVAPLLSCSCRLDTTALFPGTR